MLISKDYTKEEIKKAIKKKFGTIKKYSESKGVSEGAMYERLQELSDNFILELVKDNILPNELSQSNEDISGNQKNLLGSNRNIIKETNNHYNNDPRLVEVLLGNIEFLKKENEGLKGEIEKLKIEVANKKKSSKR
jgi:hypothetical protein